MFGTLKPVGERPTGASQLLPTRRHYFALYATYTKTFFCQPAYRVFAVCLVAEIEIPSFSCRLVEGRTTQRRLYCVNNYVYGF